MYYKDSEKIISKIITSSVKTYSATINPCKSCQFYVPYIVNGKHIVPLSKCNKYMNSINTRLNQTTIKEPIFANIMRSNDIFCGKNGRFYSPFKDL